MNKEKPRNFQGLQSNGNNIAFVQNLQSERTKKCSLNHSLDEVVNS